MRFFNRPMPTVRPESSINLQMAPSRYKSLGQMHRNGRRGYVTVNCLYVAIHMNMSGSQSHFPCRSLEAENLILQLADDSGFFITQRLGAFLHGPHHWRRTTDQQFHVWSRGGQMILYKVSRNIRRAQIAAGPTFMKSGVTKPTPPVQLSGGFCRT